MTKILAKKDYLTNARVDAIQNFYGCAIRDNKSNTDKMSKEIYMQALLTNPCIQTAQQVTKVGVATKGILPLEYLYINLLRIHYLRL